MYTTGGASTASAAVVINEQVIQEEGDDSLIKLYTASGVHPPKTSSIRHRLLEVRPPSKCLSQVRSRPRISQNQINQQATMQSQYQMNCASSSDNLGQGMHKPLNERVLEAYSSGKKRQKSQRFFLPQQIPNKNKTHIQVIDQYYSGLSR
jgi:hypothetical protein